MLVAKSKFILLTLLFTALFSSIANAGPRGDMKRKALADAESIRAGGEPLDRCSFNVAFSPDITVVEILGETSFEMGDKIKSIDGNDFSGKDKDAFIGYLKTQAHSKSSNVSVIRDGRVRTFSETCSNSRPKFDAILKALDFAAKKKFDDCYETLADREDLGFVGLQYQLQCAEVSRNKERYDYGRLTHDTMEIAINSARWYPPARKEVMKALIYASEPLNESVGKTETEKLINLAKAWPGDEGLWEKMQPNFDQFRVTGENAVINRLIDPSSAKVEWPFNFRFGTWKPILQSKIEGYWTCGFVNARNRMGGYTGKSYFVVVMGPEGSVKYIDIASADDVDIIASQCQNSVKLLNPREEKLNRMTSGNNKTSIADELATLVNLHKDGALTDEEFKTAKEKALSK